MTSWPEEIDPRALRQPDAYSCGAAVVVAARMLHEPGHRPADPQQEIRRVHRELVAVRHAGQLQVPWPRALGTPPWALARELSRLHDRDIGVEVARFTPAASYDHLAARAAERPTGVYLGNAWLPRHVVLTLETHAGAVTVFDPGHGELVQVPRRRWRDHEVGVAGWRHFWAVV
ncbi:hypothetical protein KUV85_01280 [Nocardioides panacisoli]|uniref:hypothetical protein n=1 Tax=Nocardioides panacisoli TaxID=627624 RepID=UPI001C62CA0B|nr:hypothetical protein [Nocardioides panacisoli]QYJ04340.1 hypothetical protein KUV85_01280 [Nocardioides panacisoli]